MLTDDAAEAAAGYLVNLETSPPEVTRVEGDPTDQADSARAYAGRSRAYVGGVLLLAAVILGLFIWIAGTDTKAFYLLPGALGAVGGLLLLTGARAYTEST